MYAGEMSRFISSLPSGLATLLSWYQYPPLGIADVCRRKAVVLSVISQWIWLSMELVSVYGTSKSE
jgi:hypothetical protein